MTLKVLVGGVPFQSSLQPPVRSLPHHCYCSSISEEQPLPGAGVPSSAGTSGVDPPGKTQPTSGAAPCPWPFAPFCLVPLSQVPTATPPPLQKQSVALLDGTGMRAYTSNRFPPDGNGLFDRNIEKIHIPEIRSSEPNSRFLQQLHSGKGTNFAHWEPRFKSENKFPMGVPQWLRCTAAPPCKQNKRGTGCDRLSRSCLWYRQERCFRGKCDKLPGNTPALLSCLCPYSPPSPAGST